MLSARLPHRGFTLIELLCVLMVAAILAAIAYPAYGAFVARSRRSDAVLALMQLQGAQERHRFSHRGYADLSELAWPAESPSRHYRLHMVERSDDGYAAMASATGMQRSDASCRHMRITVRGIDTAYTSGPDETTANPAADNRRCWSQ